MRLPRRLEETVVVHNFVGCLYTDVAKTTLRNFRRVRTAFSGKLPKARGPNLAARISPCTANFRDFLSQTTQTPLELQPLAADELKAIVHSFNSYRGSGVDNNPMRIIKLSIDIIVEPLAEIINVSLVSGCFPDTLKIAKVLPIFKTGDPEKLENYRPISILPAFSKLYEKVVYNRIYKYLQIIIFFITISLDFVEIIVRIWH